MGFCKPGDNCFNASIIAQINQAILDQQSNVTRLEDCGVIFPDPCPDILACLSGGTGGGTSYWSASTSGDIHNLGLSTIKVGVGTATPANQLHVVSAVMTNPIRVERLLAQEDNYVTVDDNGVFYISQNTSDIIDGGDF